MMNKLFATVAGAALLASVGVANAGQRAPLTDAQLDKVVAGNSATVVATALNVVAVATFALSAAPTAASASITANFDNLGAGTPHQLTLAAQAIVP